MKLIAVLLLCRYLIFFVRVIIFIVLFRVGIFVCFVFLLGFRC